MVEFRWFYRTGECESTKRKSHKTQIDYLELLEFDGNRSVSDYVLRTKEIIKTIQQVNIIIIQHFDYETE